MKLIQRHRAINAALKDEIAQIHALQISKCQTPEQAAAAQAKPSA
jgi:stress-induced morphogen